jgi:alpha-beta hydrolase superfamily lysophospholipase
MDVLLDGASALYGSDAVAGVVNVIMRRSLEGQESRIRVGAAGGGAEDVTVSHLAGTTWPGGGGFLSWEYQTVNALNAGDRAFTADGDLRPFGGSDRRLVYSSPGNILAFDPAVGGYVAAWGIRPGPSGYAGGPGDFAAGVANLTGQLDGVDLLPDLERHSLYGRVRQSVGERLDVSADVRFSRRTYGFDNAAPVTIFSVSAANPWFVSPNGAASHLIGYPGTVEAGRYVEATGLQTLGPRAQLLAARGYAVLSAAVPDESRTTREAMFDDFTRATDMAVDAALAAEPGLPADRLALLGHSFGGYTALAIATRTDRYRSVVAWAAPTDPANAWAELRPHAWIWPEQAMSLDTAPGSIEGGQARLGGPPWRDVEGYAAASPFMTADRITAAVLLITADRDYVPMSHAQRMLTALHRQGKWGRLVTYWGETHSNASPANVRDVYQEIFDWLDRTLGDEALMPRAGAAPMPEPSPRSPPSS